MMALSEILLFLIAIYFAYRNIRLRKEVDEGDQFIEAYHRALRDAAMNARERPRD